MAVEPYPLLYGPAGFPLTGTRRIISVANPGAGNELSYTNDRGRPMMVMTLRADLLASATVANRVPSLIFDDGTTEYFRISAAANVTANQRWRLVAVQGGVTTITVTAGVMTVGGLPPLPLDPGFRITTSTAALDTGDAWQNIALGVVEFMDPADLADYERQMGG